MRVSLNWLKDYVDIEMPPEDLGHLLTMAGLEVEGLEPVGQGLEDVVVAKILTVEPHPAADKLFLCRLDTGKDRVKVVCGAPNVESGLFVPLALPGVKLPDGTVIEESRIRGEKSTGMLLAEDELGLTDDHSGIMVLPSHAAPGIPLTAVCPLADWILDVAVTPNRPDWASVIGVAREIAALTGGELRKPPVDIEEQGPAIGALTSVAIDAPGGCPRYAAGIIQDVEPGPSPFWMRYRLFSSGIRSINNIVDVTNYVLLELNQPLHAFDYDRLKQNRIVVRWAEEGEKFTTLDGETRSLESDILMIRDGERPVALAGVMGGLNSEIFAGTRNVLIESAFFDPLTIRKGAKKLGVSTEASYRFERGVDIEGVTGALKRSLYLMSLLAGGRIASGIIDNYPCPPSLPAIDLSVEKTNRLLGSTHSIGSIQNMLSSLEMKVEAVSDKDLKVVPPYFRVDVTRDVDLVEEVARLDGYENIPVTYPRVRPSDESEEIELLLRDRVKSIMAGMGFSEIITYSFISSEWADILGADEESSLRSFIRLMNPLSVEQEVMRTSLLPGLLISVKTNVLREEEDLKLFEWGKVFIKEKKGRLPLERTMLAGAMSGPYRRKTWYTDERPVDFYDIKGVLEALFKALGGEDFEFRKGAGSAGYDPEQSSDIVSKEGTETLGRVGKVPQKVMKALELENKDVYVFEVDIPALLKTLEGPKKFRPLARFPAVYRDISIIVKRRIESRALIDLIKREGGELVESVNIFDVYEGKNMDPSEKAIALRICYRSNEGTLEGKVVNRLHEAIIGKIEKEIGGRLREG